MQVGGVTYTEPADSLLSSRYDWFLLGLVAFLYLTAIVYGLVNRRK